MGQTTNYSRYKTLFSLLAVALLLWRAAGAMELTKFPWDGYFNSPDGYVTQVIAGGPTDRAGLKVGDVVTKQDGIALENTKAWIEHGRTAIGSAGNVTVKRNGTEQTLNFTYEGWPTSNLIFGPGSGMLFSLAFLLLGLLVYLKNPTRLSTTFCALGLLFAFFGVSPYFASPTLRLLVSAISILLIGVAIALLLDYCLHYPGAKRILTERPWLRRVIYIIAPALSLLMAAINLTTPDTIGNRSMVFSVLVPLIFGGYILLSVIAVLHSYLKAGAEERNATGLNLMLMGMVIGFGPTLISLLAHALNPHMGDLPGERFWGITMLAVPIGLARALMKLEPAPAIGRDTA